METQNRMKDFVPVPRIIKNDYINGKLTKNEFDVLIWIFLNTNPYNGFHSISYEGLRQDLRNDIGYDNARKIISSLRIKHYIYFVNHRGRTGSFPVYPINFLLTSKEIQTEDYVKNKLSITTRLQRKETPDAEPENNFNARHHNFREQRMVSARHILANSVTAQITTPNNDNETKTYKGSIIAVKDFSPKNHPEQICWEIAKSLKEEDMRFILNRLKMYGLGMIERAWGIFEETNRENINNPAAYFNKLIDDINKD
jgi:hypothetical protein